MDPYDSRWISRSDAESKGTDGLDRQMFGLGPFRGSTTWDSQECPGRRNLLWCRSRTVVTSETSFGSGFFHVDLAPLPVFGLDYRPGHPVFNPEVRVWTLPPTPTSRPASFLSDVTRVDRIPSSVSSFVSFRPWTRGPMTMTTPRP